MPAVCRRGLLPRRQTPQQASDPSCLLLAELPGRPQDPVGQVLPRAQRSPLSPQGEARTQGLGAASSRPRGRPPAEGTWPWAAWSMGEGLGQQTR